MTTKDKVVHMLARTLGMDSRVALRLRIVALRSFKTPDTIRLNEKLVAPDFERLFTDGEKLIESEGTKTPFSEVKTTVEQSLQDLELSLVTQLTRGDIRSWMNDNKQYIEPQFTDLRLDWLWDFSWSYLIWGKEYTSEPDLILYTAIRGPKPEGMRNVPYQSVLNGIRKDRLKAKERKLYQAAKEGDVDGLVQMGLSKEEAHQAIRKVGKVSV